MENPVVKALFVGVAVVLTIVVIAWGISTHNRTKPLQGTADNSLTTINTNLAAEQYNDVIDQDVTGAVVRNTIASKASTNLEIFVKTKNYTPASSSTDDALGRKYISASYNINSVTNNDYIEPTAMFHCEGRAAGTNGTINRLIFKQN